MWKCTNTQTGEIKILAESEAFDLDRRVWSLQEATDRSKERPKNKWPDKPDNTFGEITGKM